MCCVAWRKKHGERDSANSRNTKFPRGRFISFDSCLSEPKRRFNPRDGDTPSRHYRAGTRRFPIARNRLGWDWNAAESNQQWTVDGRTERGWLILYAMPLTASQFPSNCNQLGFFRQNPIQTFKSNCYCICRGVNYRTGIAWFSAWLDSVRWSSRWS